MADDEETNVDDGGGGGENEEESSTFSKVGGMFGSDKEKDADTKEEATPKKEKVKPKSLFDLAALKEFGLSVLTLFIETVIISVICVNIMFFSAPESIKKKQP